jgi:phenylpropionate dioxygenase-like ring-hydroxylating dioxygenase large terminal subunit
MGNFQKFGQFTIVEQLKINWMWFLYPLFIEIQLVKEIIQWSNGPVVKWEENQMIFYVNNQKDHGQYPLKPKEIENYEKLFSLQFQMPNLWQNRISDAIRIVAAFAPIDHEHTRIYQQFIKIPVLKQLINQGSKVSNRYILHQDRRVALIQKPIKTELKMSENLIQGDAPIIEYRKRRA